MKVKCIKVINSITGEVTKKDVWLKIGKVYDVLTVLVTRNNSTKYRLISEDNHTPVLFEANQFEIISDTIPSNWVVNYEEGSYFELSPKAWTEYGFWERYFDKEPEAIEVFEKEKKIIEQTDS